MVMKRKILFCFLVFILLLSFVPYTYYLSSVFAENEATRIVSAEKLHLREGPGLSYNIIDTLQKNDKLHVLKQQGDWIYVEVKDLKGWVAAWLTQEVGAKEKYAISQVDYLNIRLEPSLNSSVLGQLHTGDQVVVLSERENWVQIQYGELTGWVSSDYIIINETENVVEHIQENKNETTFEDEPETFTIVVDAVIVRNKPSLSSKELGIAKKGEQYKIIGRDHHWINIEFKGKKGWLYSFYGSFEKTQEDNQNPKKVMIIYNGTNLRQEPSTSSPVMKNAYAGEQYEIIDTEGDWYKIQLSNKEVGYVANWVVSTNDNNTSIEKKQKRKKGTLHGVTIVLDPGHGGNDQGTTGIRETLEKEVTLKTAELLKAKLQAAGAEVILTRDSDVYVGLRKRVAIAHQHAAEAFISIHYDAIEDRTISGFTTYYYHPYQQTLAQYVHEGLSNQVSIRDRGVQQGDYLVLRENKQRAILVELGYLSNPSEEKLITTELYREKATMGLYEGILNYFDAQLEE